ncbi:MAG: (2Fe-2S)-binding protein [Mesorhizobium sp.]|uniref:(2Fe-2S)-binding protein n=1 Tax=Mesorhizobium sp. TaxID=1871066 RepID=UPI000FE82EF0|nr:(2Fe-2S)-binding protein [Mesorhizobium sp.]RWD19010.1 MAG: (2Fe-2S)-binding protein [Mesorhizobium sp.]
MNFRPIFEDETADLVPITVNGIVVAARNGQTLALALLESNLDHFNTNPVSGNRRLPYCMMGACFECRLIVDGARDVLACRCEVRPGMVVNTQDGDDGKI